MPALKAAVIGCGGRGRAHALGYHTAPNATLVACADTNPAAAQKLAAELDIPATYQDYRQLLAQEKPDVVSIGLWTGLHLEAVLACVEGGVKLVNCEKPIAPTWGEARRLCQACDDNDVLLTFSHQTRYGPSFCKVRDLVQQNAIGELIRIEGCGANLFDLGTHRLDRMFFYNDDQPAAHVMGQVHCAEERSIFGVPIETHGLAHIQWHNGVSGVLVTGGHNPVQDRLIGSDGIIENNGRQVRLLSSATNGWETPALDKVDIPGAESALYIHDALAWLAGGDESMTSARRALQGTELIFAAYESARRRERIDLPLDIDDSPLISMLEQGQITIPDYTAHLSEAEKADGFELLFNGKDLEAWHIIGREEGWTVDKGLLSCTGQGRGWIRPADEYADFTLRLDYRISPRGNSGIFLRTSQEGRPAFQGMEIQLLDDRRAPLTPKSNGGIYDAVAPQVDPSKPAGTWNPVEITCRGPQVEVKIHGRQTVSCDTSTHADLKDRLKTGLIGLQNHGSPIAFRNIRLKVE